MVMMQYIWLVVILILIYLIYKIFMSLLGEKTVKGKEMAVKKSGKIAAKARKAKKTIKKKGRRRK